MGQKQSKSNKSNMKTYARFSTVGIQMGVVIGGCAWLGQYLDQKYGTKTPWWTLVLSLFGVAVGLILIIREVIKMNKENDEEK